MKYSESLESDDKSDVLQSEVLKNVLIGGDANRSTKGKEKASKSITAGALQPGATYVITRASEPANAAEGKTVVSSSPCSTRVEEGKRELDADDLDS
eukprot:CAMPEP_0117062892 /NCGR_PEP_ID=MMETSP0472-20121206/43857_1 /TAXON_ID=693140 ORGANISM="Tiarina fusus, Strain LIS" /NCGR_SAMPLE_ID=MMETSP0472 /ASSEMBLY_ACC=CAM_ASM_000603 /LENGTH=96 /DNA_ID=CAMNT_0004782285 /DNA_START=1 /DNA_END=288 /DNA_ORIENTATION=+